VKITAAIATVAVLAAPASSALAQSQRAIAVIIRQTFPDDPDRAVCIADHESDGTPHHFTPTARNGSNTGLFQIDRLTWDPRLNPRAIAVVGRIDWNRMLDAAYNSAVARRIYLYDRRRGHDPWSQWSTRTLCGG